MFWLALCLVSLSLWLLPFTLVTWLENRRLRAQVAAQQRVIDSAVVLRDVVAGLVSCRDEN